MRCARALVRGAVALILFLGPTGQAETVNLFGGVPLGGFGDVAANLLMAQQLRQLRPELELRFEVSPEQVKQMAVLLPEFDPAKGVQEIGGIRFYPSPPHRLPPADVFVGMALRPSHGGPEGYAKDIILPDMLEPRIDFFDLLRRKSNAPVVFLMREHSGASYRFDGATRFDRGKTLVTGDTGPQSAGLYTMPGEPLATLTREQLEAELRKLGVAGEDLAGRKLAFGYSTYRNAAEEYLAVMKEYARRRPGEPITVVLRSGAIATDLPPNLRVVTYDSIPFSVSRALIAHSEAPILVTGDASLSLAIDYRKHFLYEQHHWKTRAARSLVDVAAERLPYFATAENRAILQRMLSLTGRGTRGLKPADIGAIAERLADPEFGRSVDQLFVGLKRDRSAAATMLEAIDAVTSLPADARTPRAVREALEGRGLPFQPGIFQRIGSACAALFRLVTSAGR